MTQPPKMPYFSKVHSEQRVTTNLLPLIAASFQQLPVTFHCSWTLQKPSVAPHSPWKSTWPFAVLVWLNLVRAALAATMTNIAP